MSILLLHLADVEPSEIVADYQLSQPNLRPFVSAVEEQAIKTALEQRGTTIQAEILSLLDGFDANQYLRKAGLRQERIDSIKLRLLD